MRLILAGLLSLLLLTTLPVASLAVQPKDPAQSGGGTSSGYPALDQLVPLSTSLAIEATEAHNQLEGLKQLDSLVGKIDEAQRSLATFDQYLQGLGPVSEWSELKLRSARQRLMAASTRQEALLEDLTRPFKAIEELHRIWIAKREFWTGWQKTAAQQGVKLPNEIYEKNLILINQIIDQATASIGSFSAVQEKFSIQQELVSNWLLQVDSAFAKLHGALTERNAPSILSQEYLAQLNAGLWVGMLENLRGYTQLPDDFAVRYSRIIMLQLAVALFLAWKLFRRARTSGPTCEKWQFLFRHPVTGGLFLSLIFSTIFFPSPPPFWRLCSLVLGTITATLLICATLERRPGLRYVIVPLALLNVCASVAEMVSLEQPFFRLLVTGGCLIIVLLCLIAANRLKTGADEEVDPLVPPLHLGALAASVVLFAEILGYAELASYLFNGLLGTLFTFLVVRLALFLGRGGIDTLLSAESVKRHRFVRRLGPATGPRLNFLMHLVVGSYALLFLLVRWRIYINPTEAFKGIRALAFKVGELQVSMELILMVVCVLYLTFILSWLLQALLDAGVMTPQGMEHGVKFAFKTLIHYSLILVGFLVAIMVAGIDMSKFAVLAGALGVGIGFGLQNIVNNFISGLILLFERPVKVGDTISLDDQWGIIRRIGLRSTVVETFEHSEVIVPNAELISQRVVNWTFSSNISRVVLPVGVAYGTPLEAVLETLLQVAREHADVLANPEATAIFVGFGDSSINFELRVWVGDINQRARIRSELGLAIDRHFRAVGIVIPFPQQDVYLHSLPADAAKG